MAKKTPVWMGPLDHFTNFLNTILQQAKTNHLEPPQ